MFYSCSLLKQDPENTPNEWDVYATLDGKNFGTDGVETVAGSHTPIDTFEFTSAGLPDVAITSYNVP